MDPSRVDVQRTASTRTAPTNRQRRTRRLAAQTKLGRDRTEREKTVALALRARRAVAGASGCGERNALPQRKPERATATRNECTERAYVTFGIILHRMRPSVVSAMSAMSVISAASTISVVGVVDVVSVVSVMIAEKRSERRVQSASWASVEASVEACRG